MMGIDSRPGDAHMHTVVGVCERFNATLRSMARAAWFDNECLWDLYLPFIVAYYNSSTHPSTGYSPFYLNHGRTFPMPWIHGKWPGLDRKSPHDGKELVYTRLTALHAAWNDAHTTRALRVHVPHT